MQRLRKSILYEHGLVRQAARYDPAHGQKTDSHPGGNGITSDKVPTEISYELDANTRPIEGVTPEQNPISGASTTVRWGFMHKPDEPRIKCMKLFLDRNQKLPHFVFHSLARSTTHDKANNFQGQPLRNSDPFEAV